MELGRMDGLETIIQEALQTAESLGNPDLVFDAQILAAKYEHKKGNTEKAIEVLFTLNAKELSPDKHAAVNFELFHLLPQDPRFRQRALELYESLYQVTPRYSYKVRLKQLKEG